MSDDLLKLAELKASDSITEAATEAFYRAQDALARGDKPAFDRASDQHRAFAAQHQKLMARATLQ